MKIPVLLSLASLAVGSPLQNDRLVVKKTVEGRGEYLSSPSPPGFTTGATKVDTDAETGTTVTASDMSNLRFYAEYSGAAYCNGNAAVGSQVTCGNNVCPTVMSDKAVILATVEFVTHPSTLHQTRPTPREAAKANPVRLITVATPPPI